MRADASRTTQVTLVLSTAVLKNLLREQNMGRRKICKIGLDFRFGLLARLDVQPVAVFHDNDSVAVGDTVPITRFGG